MRRTIDLLTCSSSFPSHLHASTQTLLFSPVSEFNFVCISCVTCLVTKQIGLLKPGFCVSVEPVNHAHAATRDELSQFSFANFLTLCYVVFPGLPNSNTIEEKVFECCIALPLWPTLLFSPDPKAERSAGNSMAEARSPIRAWQTFCSVHGRTCSEATLDGCLYMLMLIRSKKFKYPIGRRFWWFGWEFFQILRE